MELNQPLSYPGKYESYGIETNCTVCGKAFIKKAPAHKYCPDCAKEVQRETIKKWQKENKERYYQTRRDWCRQNREAVRAAKRNYYKRDKEKLRIRQREYYYKNRDYILFRNRITRCSKKHDNCDKCPYDDCIKE